MHTYYRKHEVKENGKTAVNSELSCHAGNISQFRHVTPSLQMLCGLLKLQQY